STTSPIHSYLAHSPCPSSTAISRSAAAALSLHDALPICRRAEKEQAELEALGTTDKDDNADAAGATEVTESTESTESTDASADNATATVASSPAEPEQSEEPVVTNTTTVASRRRRARYGDAHPDHYAKFNKRSQDRA